MFKQIARWVWCHQYRRHEAMFRDPRGCTFVLTPSDMDASCDHRPPPSAGEDGPECEGTAPLLAGIRAVLVDAEAVRELAEARAHIETLRGEVARWRRLHDELVERTPPVPAAEMASDPQDIYRPDPSDPDPDEWRVEGYSDDQRWALRSWHSEGGWIAYATVYDAHGTQQWSCHGVSRRAAAKALRERCGSSLPGSAERVLRAWTAEVGP
jgi:hypothetical protein